MSTNYPTQTMDIATILLALMKLKEATKANGWIPQNPQHAMLLQWLDEFGDLLPKITGLSALASRHYEALNAFLEENEFPAMFKSFDPDDKIGVAAILDKLVSWLYGPGELVDIWSPAGNKHLPGFELPPEGVIVYQVEGYSGAHLLEILTKTDDRLWLFHAPAMTPPIWLGLARLAIDVMRRKRTLVTRSSTYGGPLLVAFAGAQIPMLDFESESDLSWLLDLGMQTQNDRYWVEKASQIFKMRMDETGARVKVVTAMLMLAEAIMETPPPPYVVNGPFFGWWTQVGVTMADGNPFPMAAFYAGLDALKKPEGSLEDM